MKTPLVAIVGRPNVGKSTFMNTIVGRKCSIVDDEPGVTRDRIYASAEWCGQKFALVDTGGLDFNEKGNIYNVHIREQVDIAIELADCIIFLVDGLVGLDKDDVEIAKYLRRVKKPVVLVVNKLDNEKLEQSTLHEFYKLGLGEPYAISCTQKTGLGDVLDAIIGAVIPSGAEIVPDGEEPERIAIVGKPNAGKSSIINKLLGDKRVLVSDVAGTTRDSVDTPFKCNGKEYILTDTAGIRRKRSVETQTIEHYSVLRALGAIRDSDVCILVVDAVEGLTEQDVRLAGYIQEMGKPSVICINKWDLVEKDTHTMVAYGKNLMRDLAFMPYFKAIYISALSGQRVGEIMKAVETVLQNSKTRITTGTLNTLISQFVATTQPPFVGHRRAKFLYSTQVGISPPTFALFVNEKDIVPSTYLRYLENCLRKSVDLTGTPIKLLLRNRSSKGDK